MHSTLRGGIVQEKFAAREAHSYVRRKKSKKVSKSLVFFSRGHAAADVALGLVDLQHLLDLQV